MIDNRRYARVPLDLPMEFLPAGARARVAARSRDISLGGMFFETATLLAYSDKLTVYLTIPGEKAPFELGGTVRWVGEDGMGIQFDLMGAKETYAITQYAKAQSGG